MQIYRFKYERNYFYIAPTCISRGITKSRVMKEVIIYFALAIMNLLVFSYDIEYDRDVYKWLWLLNSIICLIACAVYYTKIKINIKKNQE